MIGIVTLPLIPVRKSDSESSELYTQLLFGEQVEIVEERERWLLVRNLSDDYCGWIDKKMILITQNEPKVLQNNFIINTPFQECKNTDTGETLFLPGGSCVELITDSEFAIGTTTYSLNAKKNDSGKLKNDLIIDLAKQFLNAPYLWGGKSIMGIDCSGLVQIVFTMSGIQLPRDARQQVDKGEVIDFLSEVKPGDLAFFENPEGRITHVGILINSHQIIHSSGWVKIENIDSQGIISSRTGEYTHKLRVVKRIFIG